MSEEVYEERRDIRYFQRNVSIKIYHLILDTTPLNANNYTVSISTIQLVRFDNGVLIVVSCLK